MANPPVDPTTAFRPSLEALHKHAIEDQQRAAAAWEGIVAREKVAYEAGRQSRDAEVDALRFQRDLLAERLGVGPGPRQRSIEERVRLLEMLVAKAEPVLVRRMLAMFDVDWKPIARGP
jgi:hypothetical protein